MRISTSLLFRQGVNAIQKQQTGVAKTQLQVATGKRILTPADDPVGAKRVLDLNELLTLNGQYQRHAEAATRRLALEDTALEGIGNVLQRVRELTIQGHNGAYTDSDRQAIAAEVAERLDELLGLANSQDGNNEYLFAGDKVQTQPFARAAGGGFVYSGDNGQRQLPIGPGYQVAVGDPGSTVFNIPNGNVFQSVQNLIDAFHSSTGDEAGRARLSNEVNRALSDLDQALENVRRVRAGVGARLNAIDNEKQANEDFSLHLKERLSQVQDLDYAEAISRLNQQLAGLQAAQQSFVRLQNLSLFNFL